MVKHKTNIKLYEILFCIYCIWFFLPFFKGFLFGGVWNNIFFSFYAMSMVLVGIRNIRKSHSAIERKVIYPIVIYMIVFTIMCMLDIKDANAHIRVSFTYWGTFLFFFCTEKDYESRIRIGRFLIVLYAITYMTTLIGILRDPSAARAISHAGTEEEETNLLLMKNIASVFFIQTSILLVPLGFYGISSKNIYLKIISIIFIVVECVLILNASFTIAFILFLVITYLSIVFVHRQRNKKTIAFVALESFFIIVLLVVTIEWDDLFVKIGDSINNEFISDRMYSISNMLSGAGSSGDAGFRAELYISSFNTFMDNPFGVGPNYSYIEFDEGIGHHSQLLDDLARYGIMAIVFYVCYLSAYYRLLYSRYKRVGMESLVMPIMVTYIMMIILNLSFRSPYESIFMLFILPSIPEMKRCQRNENIICNT